MRSIKKLLGIREGYMEYSEYSAYIAFLSELRFQQQTRKESIENSSLLG